MYRSIEVKLCRKNTIAAVFGGGGKAPEPPKPVEPPVKPEQAAAVAEKNPIVPNVPRTETAFGGVSSLANYAKTAKKVLLGQ